MDCNKTDMRYWQMVGEFIIPWGSTFHWNLLTGAMWFIEGTEKAKRFLFLGCRGIVKKQSCKLIITIDHPFGTIEGEGNLGCKGPISNMVLLTFLKSINICHFLDFFFITKKGEFHGENEGSIWYFCNCSFTNCVRAANFSLVRGHWGVHIGVLDSQSRGSGNNSMAPSKKVHLKKLWLSFVQENPFPTD